LNNNVFFSQKIYLNKSDASTHLSMLDILDINTHVVQFAIPA